MALVYVADTGYNFSKMMLFNGYLPTTHDGLMDTINNASPVSTPTLVFAGENDFAFAPLADDLNSKFSNSTYLISNTAGHHLPFSSDDTFDDVINFINN